MSQNGSVDVLEITPEVREMLKKNYFFVNKAKFPSFFATSILFTYFFMGLSIFVVYYFKPVFTTYLFAAILMIVAFFYTFRWIKPYFNQRQQYHLRPSTDQIEKWLVEDLRDYVKSAAVEMLSLNPATITPENFIIVPHPIWWHVDGVPDEHITKYDAGEYNVFATYGISVLALTENYISYYNCVFNWLDNELVDPYTLEFFFDDISSIRVEQQYVDHAAIDYEPPKVEPIVTVDEEGNEVVEEPEQEEIPSVGVAQVVVVRNKSGETMDIITSIPNLEASPRISLKTEKVMQTLRIMLRNRRYGEKFKIEESQPEENEETEE